MKYIDLTHIFKDNMPVYPGDSQSELTQVAFFEKDGHNNFAVTTGLHVGTHIDGPLHMVEGRKRLSDFPPEHFFGTGHLIDARNQPIDAHLLDGHQISRGDIVVVMTGFSDKFGTPEYFHSYPEITVGFAEKIIELGVKMIGVDSPSPDREPYTIHKLLLNKEVLIIENLTNLEALSAQEPFQVVALPIKFDADSAPARVIVTVV